MSKLEEVIKQLEFVVSISIPVTYSGIDGRSHTKESVFAHDVEEAIDDLIELNKPVQYVVEVKMQTHPAIMYRFKPTPLCYEAVILHGDERVELGGLYQDLESLTKATLWKLNHAHRLVNLPLITINQIIFVEV